MRIGDFGVKVGELPAGPLNKISDVPGVTVGHCTVVEPDSQHRGDRGDARAGQSICGKAHRGGLCAERIWKDRRIGAN